MKKIKILNKNDKNYGKIIEVTPIFTNGLTFYENLETTEIYWTLDVELVEDD